MGLIDFLLNFSKKNQTESGQRRFAQMENEIDIIIADADPEKVYDEFANFDNLAEQMRYHTLQNATKFGYDLVVFNDTSGCCCSHCARLAGRVYSISGKSKEFPKLPNYVKIHGNFHTGCRCAISVYTGGDVWCLGKQLPPVLASNRSLTDSRTDEQRALYCEYLERLKFEEQKQTDREEYERLCSALPNDSPKSFGAYRRMKNEYTAGFQRLQKKAADIGIQI